MTSQRDWRGLLFVAPFLLLYSIILIFPLLRGLWLSLNQVDLFGAGHFVGTALFMQARKPKDIGFLEGDEVIYIDQEKSFIADMRQNDAARQTTKPAIPSPGSTRKIRVRARWR